VVVPAAVTDDQLRVSAAFRQGGRFPVLSYRHTNGVSLNFPPTVNRFFSSKFNIFDFEFIISTDKQRM
jgi:hypothetical protein